MFNKSMITLARELRGSTQANLAQAIGTISQIELSNLETGRSQLTEEYVTKIATALNLPLSFFRKEDPVVKRISKFYYRKRSTLAAKQQNVIEAQIKILRSMILELLKELEVSTRELPKLAVRQNSSPEDIAMKARLFFNLDDGPIENPVSLIEQLGIPVIFLNSTAEKFSGMTIQTDINMPIIVLNKNLPNDHKRFTLAHELGHLIMHIPFADDPEFLASMDDLDEVEKQADRFAGAFLMPANEIKRQMAHSFTYSRLTEFKLYWKVSKQATIYRAKDLGIINQQKFTNLFVELSRNGERKRELLEVPIDEPQLFKEILQVWETELKKSKKELAEEIGGIPLSEFQDWLGMPKPLLRVA